MGKTYRNEVLEADIAHKYICNSQLHRVTRKDRPCHGT
ncbi:hypothetical protein ACP70R_029549 [Stipagrostis hirtigluma subsp. patula]